MFTLAATASGSVVPDSGLILLETFWLAVSFVMTTLFVAFMIVFVIERYLKQERSPSFSP